MIDSNWCGISQANFSWENGTTKPTKKRVKAYRLFLWASSTKESFPVERSMGREYIFRRTLAFMREILLMGRSMGKENVWIKQKIAFMKESGVVAKWRDLVIFRARATSFKGSSSAILRKGLAFSSFRMETGILESIGTISSRAKESTFGQMDHPI